VDMTGMESFDVAARAVDCSDTSGGCRFGTLPSGLLLDTCGSNVTVRRTGGFDIEACGDGTSGVVSEGEEAEAIVMTAGQSIYRIGVDRAASRSSDITGFAEHGRLDMAAYVRRYLRY
jgi:hypothetical protein